MRYQKLEIQSLNGCQCSATARSIIFIRQSMQWGSSRMHLSTFTTATMVAMCLIVQLWASSSIAQAGFNPMDSTHVSVPPIASRCITLQDPVNDAEISSGFGMRRGDGEATQSHKGIDYSARTGTSVSAAADGEIVGVGLHRTYGRFIKVNHGGGLTTMYAHLNRINRYLSTGSKVSQGDVIGYVGRTGRVTGSNLHFEVRKNDKPLNPMLFLDNASIANYDRFSCGSGLI